MNKLLIFCVLLLLGCQNEKAEPNSDELTLNIEEKLIEEACLGYVEGFYEGDTLKIKESIRPRLYKLGFWKNDSGNYELDSYMTFEQAKNYAKNVMENENYAEESSPKKVDVLDIMNHIASAKITAWWGVDYILLSKSGDKWMVEQVIWEGPLESETIQN